MAFTAPTTRSTNFLVTAAIWNAEHVDNFNTAVQHLVVRKTSDQSVTSSIVCVNDTALVMAIAANEIWKFHFGLVYTAATTGDLRVTFTFPASGEIVAGSVYPDNTDVLSFIQYTGTTTPATEKRYAGFGATVKAYLSIDGVFINAGSAGNLQLQFAQGTSDAAATTIRANSTLWAVKLA